MKKSIFITLLIAGLMSCNKSNKTSRKTISNRDIPSHKEKTAWNEQSSNFNNIGAIHRAIPSASIDSITIFEIYDAKCLVREGYRNSVKSKHWYEKYHFLYGIITEVSQDLNKVRVRVVNCSESFIAQFRDIKNEEWAVILDQTSFGKQNEMSRAAAENLPHLLVPGRRIKFAMVEGFPGCGTVCNGMWMFTYLEALNGDRF